eukprot:TRINITY_DN3721_c0_g1_i1.p1 TRINITY_DN3721_c0_g1~~TRINITY_DN3721_c0_g1_i1.p1  ORF type:complete len:264 (+),score=58.99 TRINITY_DN3721_c0_g1_i1:47-793(+)
MCIRDRRKEIEQIVGLKQIPELGRLGRFSFGKVEHQNLEGFLDLTSLMENGGFSPRFAQLTSRSSEVNLHEKSLLTPENVKQPTLPKRYEKEMPPKTIQKPATKTNKQKKNSFPTQIYYPELNKENRNKIQNRKHENAVGKISCGGSQKDLRERKEIEFVGPFEAKVDPVCKKKSEKFDLKFLEKVFKKRLIPRIEKLNNHFRYPESQFSSIPRITYNSGFVQTAFKRGFEACIQDLENEFSILAGRH